jgi:hypothetical protein
MREKICGGADDVNRKGGAGAITRRLLLLIFPSR